MNTPREDQVRVALSGCSHRPKMSAMSAPRTGDVIKCYICKRDRTVLGMVTTWAYAVLDCQNCDWTFNNLKTFGKKRLISIAERHADNRTHVVTVVHDGIVDVIKGKPDGQLPLIDDLLL